MSRTSLVNLLPSSDSTQRVTRRRIMGAAQLHRFRQTREWRNVTGTPRLPWDARTYQHKENYTREVAAFGDALQAQAAVRKTIGFRDCTTDRMVPYTHTDTKDIALGSEAGLHHITRRRPANAHIQAGGDGGCSRR